MTEQLALFAADPERRLTRAEAGLSRDTRPGPEWLLAELVARGLDREHLRTAAGLCLELDEPSESASVTGRLLTAREVAELLGVSTETVLPWVRRGELPAVRLPGGAIRFREDQLERWLEQRATPGREELSRTPQGAAHWQPTAPSGTLTAVTHPPSEED